MNEITQIIEITEAARARILASHDTYARWLSQVEFVRAARFANLQRYLNQLEGSK
jgi:hypothetical protein